MEDVLTIIQKYGDDFKRRVKAGGYWGDIEILKSVDNYFETHLSKVFGSTDPEVDAKTQRDLISIGAYVGEVMIANMIGSFWQLDEDEPNNIQKVMVVNRFGTCAWPMEKVLKRYFNGPEDSLFGYVYLSVDMFSKEFQRQEKAAKKEKKKWWNI